MWWYIAGVKRPLPCPPTASSKLRRAESVCSTESYQGSLPEEIPEGTSTFTERHFVLSWRSQYFGLTMTSLDVKCFAQYVRTTKKKNAFATSGLSNFRRSALIDQSKSSEYTDAIRAMLEAKQAAPVFCNT